MQGVDLSGSNFGNDDLTSTNFSSVELAGANLSDSLLIFTDLRGANLSGANLSGAVIVTDFSDFFGTQDNLLQGANLSGADLTGAFGSFNLSESTTEGTICPDGIVNDGSGCQSGPIPEDLMIQLAAQSGITVNTTVRNTTIRYAGLHAWVPGLSTAQAEQAIIIGEQTWKNLAGEDAVETLNQTVWFFDIGSLADENDGEFLRKIRVSFEADSRISSAEDWSTTHREVERNGGMIFGTPGLLSLQFVVASLASIASAFVFLSLVLSQRKKDLAILQAIGASPNQVIRLTLFEILSIVLVSMALGILLGVGISYAFNGFFSVFGFIFQIFGGSGTPIDRELVWPWWELLLVNGTVIAVVVLALFFTTRNALKADLAGREMEKKHQTSILEAHALYHIYESKAEDGNVVALRGLHCRVMEGEAVAVVGPSGSGKSTLLKCLGGLMKASSGFVSLSGNNMTRLTGKELVELRQKTVSFIFQEGNLLPHLSALDNVAQPLRHQGVPHKEAKKRATDMLEELGVGHRMKALPATLSGGEQQRVAVARALITDPKLILADEPTGSLDPVTSVAVLDLFKELHEKKDVSFLIVTHSREVADFADRILELRDGRFVAQRGADVDLSDLSEGAREIFMDDLGTVSLPPDIVLEMGGSGAYRVEELEAGRLTLVNTENEEIFAVNTALKLIGDCPACGFKYFNDEILQCPECGASRPKA